MPDVDWPAVWGHLGHVHLLHCWVLDPKTQGCFYLQVQLLGLFSLQQLLQIRDWLEATAF